MEGPRPAPVLLAAVLLGACATPNYPPEQPQTVARPPPRWEKPSQVAPPAPPAPRGEAIPLSELPGWYAEDHAAALSAFQAGCAVARDPTMAAACREARSLGPLGEAEARAFLERRFQASRIGDDGVLTAYFVPEYEARASLEPPFTAPVRPKPYGAGPFGDRAAIEAAEADDALAWMKPEDLFFMQIQGSGVLDMPDGSRLKATFAFSNGQPFVAIAGIMRRDGDLPARGSTGEGIRAWLADHRGPEADAVMQQDPRYVFFAVSPDDGRESAGTAGVPLIAGRSIAIDPSYHDFGGPYWIDADSPTLTGAPELYRRLVMALDTGGAIKGPVRADLYLGRGPTAGDEAGRVRHVMKLYALVPIQP